MHDSYSQTAQENALLVCDDNTNCGLRTESRNVGPETHPQYAGETTNVFYHKFYELKQNTTPAVKTYIVCI